MSKEIISEYFSNLGKRSLKTMTKSQRIERARKAGLAKGKKTDQKGSKGQT